MAVQCKNGDVTFDTSVTSITATNADLISVGTAVPAGELPGAGELYTSFGIAQPTVSKYATECPMQKGKASSLDIAPLTILNSGTLQPRKWQLTGNDCSTAAHALAAQSPR